MIFYFENALSQIQNHLVGEQKGLDNYGMVGEDNWVCDTSKFLNWMSDYFVIHSNSARKYLQVI